jgi:hypothetical protein
LQPATFEEGDALFVLKHPLWRIVLAAVDLDYKPSLDANKVKNVWAERMLSAEFGSQMLASQMVPKQRFRVRSRRPEIPRESDLLFARPFLLIS